MNRRDFIQKSGTGGLALLSANTVAQNLNLNPEELKTLELKNNINHSVCHWCYGDIPIEDFLKIIKNMGIKAIDLVGPEYFDLLKKYDMHCSMCWGAEISLVEGFNDPKNHAQLIENYSRVIPQVAAAGFTNLICFSGNRNGMNDYVGIENCVKGLSEIMPLAEEHGVVLQMELFNQQNHPDYMCDSSIWGVELCRRLGSDNFKLLFDIYHMQIQEGDIINSIRKYHQYFGHYHTAGVPGRNEIGEDQELYYPAIMKEILKTGYQGHVAQEFIPLGEDPIASLQTAFTICDV